tara:strand:- start:2112 stop:3074 length:963 start_codon:yes stop_codon:yes gene_type:complete
MFLNKIKFNYNIKLIDDYFLEKKYDEIYKHLVSLKKQPDLFFKLLSYVSDKYLSHPIHHPFYKNKIVWVISYDLDDTNYVNKFLNFYFLENQKLEIIHDSFSKAFSDAIEELKIKDFPSELSFDDMVNKSHLYQNLVLLKNDKNIFLSTCAAFFEARNNRFYIYPQNTLAYILILRNPFQIYTKYKKENNSSQEALNFLNGYKENDLNKKNLFKYNLLENKESWNINSKSWLDENVLNTYRGKIFQYDDFYNNTEETLVEILFHLKQSGLDFEIDYDLISRFIENNIMEKSELIEVSKNEEKILKSHLDQNIINDYKFSL